MPHRVDAAVQPMQPPRLHAPRHAALVDPDLRKLLARSRHRAAARRSPRTAASAVERCSRIAEVRLHSASVSPPQLGSLDALALARTGRCVRRRFEAGAGDGDVGAAGEVDGEVAAPGCRARILGSAWSADRCAGSSTNALPVTVTRWRGTGRRRTTSRRGRRRRDRSTRSEPLAFFDRGGVEDARAGTLLREASSFGPPLRLARQLGGAPGSSVLAHGRAGADDVEDRFEIQRRVGRARLR